MLAHQKYLLSLEKQKNQKSKDVFEIPEYKILHKDSGINVLEFLLKKGQSITTLTGSMIYRDPKIKGKWGKPLGNQKSKEGSFIKQLFSGADIFYNNYENTSSDIKKIGIVPKNPSNIECIYVEPNKTYHLYNQCLLSCTSNIVISGKLKMDFIGGNLISQTVKTNDLNVGAVWIYSSGMIDTLLLKAEDEIYLNNKTLLAYEEKSITIQSKVGDVRGEGFVSLIKAKKDTLLFIQTHQEPKEKSKINIKLS